MSHATGWVVADGEIIGWYEYNGTADIAEPKVFPSREELWLHWREPENYQQTCKCPEPDIVPVSLWTSYGDDREFCKSEVCRKCWTITGHVTDDWDDICPEGSDHK